MESSAYEAGRAVGESLVVILILGALVGGGIFFLVALIKSITQKTRGWIIAAVVSGIIALVGLFGGLGMAVSKLTKVAKAQQERGDRKKRLSANNGKLRLEVPGSWKEMPELNEAASIAAGDGFKEQYVMVIENSKTDFAGSLEDFDEIVTERIRENLKDAEISDAESRKVGDFPALHRRAAGVTEKINVVYHSVSIETKTSFCQILTWTTRSRESVAEPVFREVIDSFASDDGPPVPGEAGSGTVEAGDVHSRVVTLVVDLLGLEAWKVSAESRFIEDLGADSLDTVELVMATEEEFEVEIPDEDAEKIRTVGELVRYVERKSAKDGNPEAE